MLRASSEPCIAAPLWFACDLGIHSLIATPQLEDGNKVEVAIKVPKDGAEPEVKSAFQKEMALMASIGTHPYIVT